MRYRIDSTRPERVPIIVILALVSIVGVLVGLEEALPSPDAADPLQALCFGGVGLFCFSAIFLITSSHSFPHRLVFDNGTGWLTVLDRLGGAAIPYDGISGITVSRTVDDRMTRFSAGIDLARGGRWELYASSDQRRADRYADTLRRLLDLDTAVRERPQVAVGLTPERSAPDSVRYSWKRRTNPAALAMAFLVLVSFDAILIGVGPRASGPVGYGVALGIGGALLLGALISVLRSMGQRIAVEIGRTEIRVEQRSTLTKARNYSVPVSQIARVDLSMMFSRTTTRISLIRPHEVETFLRYGQDHDRRSPP